jgi:hypothetical protein
MRRAASEEQHSAYQLLVDAEVQLLMSGTVRTEDAEELLLEAWHTCLCTVLVPVYIDRCAVPVCIDRCSTVLVYGILLASCLLMQKCSFR